MGEAILHRKIERLLVANRGEIAIRIVRAARELQMRTVAIFSEEDRGARHRFTADESYLVGEGRTPVEAYLDLDEVLRVARRARVDAIHPGYGFLAAKPALAAACAQAGITFVGPREEVIRVLGDKVAARSLARAAGVAVLPATGLLPRSCRPSSRRRGAKRARPSARTTCTPRSCCAGRATSRSRCWATSTARSCICSSAIAPCSVGIRRSSSGRRRPA